MPQAWDESSRRPKLTRILVKLHIECHKNIKCFSQNMMEMHVWRQGLVLIFRSKHDIIHLLGDGAKPHEFFAIKVDWDMPSAEKPMCCEQISENPFIFRGN